MKKFSTTSLAVILALMLTTNVFGYGGDGGGGETKTVGFGTRMSQSELLDLIGSDEWSHEPFDTTSVEPFVEANTQESDEDRIQREFQERFQRNFEQLAQAQGVLDGVKFVNEDIGWISRVLLSLSGATLAPQVGIAFLDGATSTYRDHRDDPNATVGDGLYNATINSIITIITDKIGGKIGGKVAGDFVNIASEPTRTGISSTVGTLLSETLSQSINEVRNLEVRQTGTVHISTNRNDNMQDSVGFGGGQENWGVEEMK